MNTFVHSVLSVSLILLLTATGFFCAKIGWMNAQSKSFISKFTLNIAVPGMCLHGLTSKLSRDIIEQSGKFMLVPALSILGIILLSFLIGKYVLKLHRRKLGVFMMMCSQSNSLFVGYAMCTELFGDMCVSYVMLYYLVGTCFTQLIGTSIVRWSGEAEPTSVWKNLVKILSFPPVLGVFAGIALVLMGCGLPPLINSYCKYLNDLVTPLALLLTGFIIYDVGLKSLKVDRALGVMLVFRFVVAPLSCYVLAESFGIEGLARSVVVVESAMPIVSQTVVAAAEYGADEQFAARGAAISTLANFFVIPVLMIMI